MGLFDKKAPCAICGGKVSVLFRWKIEGQPVCNECHGVVDLSNEVMEHITIEGFKEYMEFREENTLLKQRFQTTRQIDFGRHGDKFLFDMNHHLMCMDKKLRKPVFEGRQIRSFEIMEDRLPLFGGSADGLICYTSTVPERVMAMAPQIGQLKVHNIPVPFRKFFVEIHFEHPYWPLFTTDRGGTVFNGDTPDVNDYLKNYNQDVQLMEQLARALMELAFPGAPERTVTSAGITAANSSGVSAPGVAVDTVEEIRRLKDLTDKGILTEAEFTVKKRQLLGI